MRSWRGKTSKPIPVVLDQALRERIDAMSLRMGEPKSTVMRLAMRLGLESLEKSLVAVDFDASKIAAEISSAKIEAASGDILAAALNEAGAAPLPPTPAEPPPVAARYPKVRSKRDKLNPKSPSE